MACLHEVSKNAWPSGHSKLVYDFLCIILATPIEAFEVHIISDATISFLDPTDAGANAEFPFESQTNGTRLHTIEINLPLGYRQCRADYRRSKSIRVRWEPPSDFSDFDANYYEIILSILEPSLPGKETATIRVDTPSGFTRSQLDDYESGEDGDGLNSISSFFTTALLARHFAYALPQGHGKTTRMANASVDHLAEANRFFESINLQPGWEYERFVEENSGTGKRSELTIRALQGMNVSFFRDIKPASELVQSGSLDKCRRGLKMLRELSQC